jgi:riboflavin kinase/FMN adenylyltransferase
VNVVRNGDARPSGDRRRVVAIGVFDGLHLGHQKVIEEVCAMARERDALATVVTFDPHPATVLAPDRAPRLLATLDQRLEWLSALGVQEVRVLTFDEELSRESAVSFIERVLVAELHVSDVVVGEDFRFGHDRLGDVALLAREGARRGFAVHPAPIYGPGEHWSSTAVRAALATHDLEQANAMLGRPFTLRGLVEHGDARGATLGYPTANVATQPRQQLPGLGIFAGAARTLGARWWPAAISVGTRPQFHDDGAILVEAHVVGFKGDLYDRVLDVAFCSRLRGEMTFAGVAELVQQMDRDVNQTLAIFSDFPSESSALLG